MKLANLLMIVCVLFLGNITVFSQSKSVLWFSEPAKHFEESFVLGNGRVGASVFGGIDSDMIYLNDATLWAGEPVDPYMNRDAHEHIPAVREALANEEYKKADRLNRKIQGKFSESFAPLGKMFLNFNHAGKEKQYYRELDISNAVSKTTYKIDDVEYTREYFVSHPDKVVVIKLTSSKKGALNFDLKFKSLLKYKISKEGNTLKANGYAPYHAEPDYRGNIPNAVMFDENRGMRFSSFFKIKNKGGELSLTDSTISVKKAKEAVIFVSIATSFNGFDKDPAKNGLDNKAIAENQLNGAFSKKYEKVKKAHLTDYKSFFDRVKLDLRNTTAPKLPIDERLKRYAKGEEDKNLEILYFQYGRYLLISSSRTKGAPANLQGIWNPYMRPPWSSNYTMNINVEENYWLAECANLSEMHMPFLTFIENLSKTGTVTAKTFYGVDKGWASCHNSDIWAMSNPVGDFGKGHPVWACWNMSGTWVVTHLWDHYLYTQNKEFLKNKAYPLMKGAAEFCLNWMVKDKKGNLITSPSTSPENLYQIPGGYRGATLYGATSDLAMIRECFGQVIKASEILGIDADFRSELQKALENLYPYQIGSKGHLQEWYHDWDDADPQHRHQTHLFGLYPGNHISPLSTPKLANACKKSLEIKGDKSTGWSQGWRINLWARLFDGNSAYKMYRQLLRYVDPSGLEFNYSDGGGTYPNLMDAHPPFQIDGNFGGATGVIEMLMQSNEDEIRVLPALPDVWNSGIIEGICARGGFNLSIEWDNRKLKSLKVLSKTGNKCTIRYGEKVHSFNTEKGKTYQFDGNLKIN